MRDHRQHQNPEMVTVSRAQLSGKMKSKADIYKILTKEGQLYLPPIDECPMIFIKDVLMGKKKVSAVPPSQLQTLFSIGSQEL